MTPTPVCLEQCRFGFYAMRHTLTPLRSFLVVNFIALIRTKQAHIWAWVTPSTNKSSPIFMSRKGYFLSELRGVGIGFFSAIDKLYTHTLKVQNNFIFASQLYWGYDKCVPWTTKDVGKKNSKVKSAKGKRQWTDVANSVLKRTGDEGLAIREANGVAKKMARKRA